ncbi:hypothetical protein pb186bvf_011370 [Paramecium bursaria]
MNWDHEYAQHRRSLERIVARENKVKDDQKEILQDRRMPTEKFILVANLSRRKYQVEQYIQIKFYQGKYKILKRENSQNTSKINLFIEKLLSNKYHALKIKFQQEVALENRKMEMRMNKLKPAVHTL